MERGPRCGRGRGRLCGGAKPVSSWNWWEVQQPPDHLAPARGAVGAAMRGLGLPGGLGQPRARVPLRFGPAAGVRCSPRSPSPGQPGLPGCAAPCRPSCTRPVPAALPSRLPSRAAMCSRTLPQPVFSCRYPGALDVRARCAERECVHAHVLFHLLLILHPYLDEGRVKGSLHQPSDL